MAGSPTGLGTDMAPEIDWPLDSNRIRRGMINHTFGMVRRNLNGSTRPHQGWDLFAAPGTPCFAVADGYIKLIRTEGDYGNTIVLAFIFEGDELFAAYSHLSHIGVKVGQVVRRGEQIGLTGNTGNAASMRGDDCHLHFELRDVPAPGRGLSNRLSPLHLFGECPLHAPVMRRAA
ncbi:M23 family peptidase [Sphingorhabdus pulchriflava]|uniref:M23 family peptidase n=1 Tax=Sphingorhabdus pulchriflava TaxID=2292257 RepID=A0A371BG03_9SPHN|nr:M23 family metallopeptidase [Sphingorhabdus pulchriflava]RDV06448.1 M23 family peptidase [Sphingorhabdus pulchriflava]